MSIGQAAGISRARKGADRDAVKRITTAPRPAPSPRPALTPPSQSPRTEAGRRAQRQLSASANFTVSEFRRDLSAACGSLEKAFRKMDIFETGLVSCLEFQEVVSQALGISVDRAFALFELIDSGKRGVVSFRDVSGEEQEKRAWQQST